MSYEIIYDKNFIKVEEKGIEKFCPIVLTGSNNCYDMNNRRSRSWWNWDYFTNGDGFATLKSMLEKTQSERSEQMKRERDSEYSDKSWGNYTGLSFGGGCQATFGQYEGIFKTGAKKAVTVEQMIEVVGYGITVGVGYYSKEKVEKQGKEARSYSVKTSQELVEKYRELEKYLEGTDVKPQIQFNGHDSIAKRIRKRLFSKPAKEKVLVDVDFFYVVKDFQEDNYVTKARKNGYSYGRTKGHGKQFRLESQAKAFAKKLSLKYGNEGRFISELVNVKTSFYI